MEIDNIKKIKWVLISIGVLILIIIYKKYNPIESNLFPKCPFNELTGYKCPGCGSQRAIHYLLNYDIINAIKENILLVLAVPYLITGFIFDLIRQPNDKVLKWRKILFGTNAIYIILVFILGFWILRNIP